MREELHVLYAELSALEDEAFFEEKLKSVSEQRRAKVLRCRHKEDQIRSLGAGLLAQILCANLGIAEADIEYLPEAIERDMTDKYYCNVTHAGKMAAVVIGRQPAGVDIEAMDRFAGEKGMKRMLPIVHKVGTPREIEYLEASYRMAMGFRWDYSLWNGFDFAAYNAGMLWTRKEARCKAEGLGLGMDLSKVECHEADGFYTEVVGAINQYVLSVYSNVQEVEIEECTMN